MVRAENYEADKWDYEIDITNVVVPTTFMAAFNPNSLPVLIKADENLFSTAQILSLNYGIVNKSSKDMLVKVNFEVNDLNAEDNDGKALIAFALSEEEVLNARQDSYIVYLTAAAADMEQDIRDSSGREIDQDTMAEDLAGVRMTVSSNPSDSIVIGQKGELVFQLEKAVFVQDDGYGIYATATPGSAVLYMATSGSAVPDMATPGTAVRVGNAADRYRIACLGAKGYTAFTLSGRMNTNTSWERLENGISIKVTYSFEDAAGTDGAYGIVAQDKYSQY